MNRTPAEQKVLKKLGIPSFRYLSKDNVMSLASELPHMDPEVAKKALEQFPNFSATVSSVVKDYKGTIDNILLNNSKSLDAYYEAQNRRLDILEKKLQQDDLPFEDQKYILAEMKDVADSLDKKDSENKHFLMNMGKLALAMAGSAILTLGAALGISLATKNSPNDDDDDNDDDIIEIE